MVRLGAGERSMVLPTTISLLECSRKPQRMIYSVSFWLLSLTTKSKTKTKKLTVLKAYLRKPSIQTAATWRLHLFPFPFLQMPSPNFQALDTILTFPVAFQHARAKSGFKRMQGTQTFPQSMASFITWYPSSPASTARSAQISCENSFSCFL